MYETAEQHLYRAAVYIFDAHWVADTKIENLCDVEGFLKKPRANFSINNNASIGLKEQSQHKFISQEDEGASYGVYIV